MKTPGIVLFAVVLNFIAAAFWAVMLVIAAIGIVTGNAVGLQPLAERVSQAGSAFAINFFFGVLAFFFALFLTFSFYVGLGLLKGQKLAWYLQVAVSIVGLLAFPVGTVLNGLILVFFFQAPVRTHFKI